MKAMICAAVALTLGGCATRAGVERGPTSGAEAEIRDVGGRVVARSSATRSGSSIRIRVQAAGLAAGVYGMHVHSAGRCDPPAFESAGPHWNPTARAHGRDNARGQHLGDLPNLVVGSDGRGAIEFTIPAAGLAAGAAPMLDSDGAALVIHARSDDYRTDPSGNSGARIACGVYR